MKQLYIRLDLLQPGDVILTGHRSLQSQAIRRVTESRFSHAALVLNQFTVIEAVTPYIKMTHFPLWFNIHADGSFSPLGALDKDVDECVILRHPQLGQLSPDFIEDTSNEIIIKFFGLNYSELHRLVEFVDDSTWQRALRELAKSWDDSQASKRVYGPFCSELAATWFEMLGLALFAETKPASGVTPGALANSLLEEVKGAVIGSETIVGKMEFQPSILPVRYSQQLAHSINQQKIQVRRAQEATNGIVQIVGEWRTKITAELPPMLTEAKNQLQTLSRAIEDLDDLKYREKIQALEGRFNENVITKAFTGESPSGEGIREFEEFQIAVWRLFMVVSSRRLQRSHDQLLTALPTNKTRKLVRKQRKIQIRRLRNLRAHISGMQKRSKLFFPVQDNVNGGS